MSVTSPPSLSKIIAEFGGPSNLGAYYRGGSYVPNTAANAAVATTPTGLRISQFVGATKYTPITTVTISGNPTAGWGKTTSLTASSNGSATSKSYSWTKLSGSTAVGISGSTTGATAVFSDNSANGSFAQHAATFRCTVSDGTSSAYADVTVTFTGTL